MAILAFQKPDKVLMLEGKTETSASFEFRPLEPGYGQTIGNALRRILLASLEGYAISQIKIDGVQDEFQTIPGVIEGMQDIILNLKQVRFRRMVETVDSETATIVISGKQEFTAEDISKGLSSFKVLNPEQHICSLEPSVKISITLVITKGRGFVPAEELRDENTPIGTIPVDAIYTPIRKVNWTVSPWRVEQKTDYETLTLEIVTDGSISPDAALQDAANILIYHFKLFTDEKKMSLENATEISNKELDEESLHMRHLLLTKLSDMGLSVRAYNCLKAADIETFADLVSYSRSELMKFRNFGRKSLNEIDVLVEKMKLSFGMDVTKYNIENKKKNV
ncbi:MAG: DNA-directed RNA polymerase subunit alpha [Bacteroidales bacterium]|nr:DNA-directed RNA polymerase subunit alpha [Bacteroidales bacterium]